MHLTLLVPGLLLPPAIRADTLFDLHAPALSRLIGHARRDELARTALDEIFDLAPPLPVAALRKVDAGKTAQGQWLCLDPVHLRVTREGIMLADPAELDLSAEESAQLLTACAPMFAAWGELGSSAPGVWEIQLSQPAALDTRPLPDCVGLPVDARLPGGNDGRAWRAMLLEAQTVLHQHPINQTREQQGRPTINSLWIWGGGSLPVLHRPALDEIWCRSPILSGLGIHTGITCKPMPARFTPAPARILAMEPRLAVPASTMNALEFRNRLLELERDWFSPVLNALQSGECRSFRLIGSGRNLQDVSYQLTRPDLWKFWRRPQSLAKLQ